MSDVRKERTWWRDARISERHRLWGLNCPAVDLDFVLIEYNNCKPRALVEYKCIGAQRIDPNSANCQTLVDLADGYRHGQLPCFIAQYNPGVWSFRMTPLNDAARKHYRHCAGETLSEQRFVKSLYLLRKDTLSDDDKKLISQLNDKI